MAKKVRWLFDVDIVGRCNLRCPSCPVGNSAEVPRPGIGGGPKAITKPAEMFFRNA